MTNIGFKRTIRLTGWFFFQSLNKIAKFKRKYINYITLKGDVNNSYYNNPIAGKIKL